MSRTLFPFTVGLLLMMLGILESSHLSGRAVEIGHSAVLARENTREQIVKLGVFGSSITEVLVSRGEDTVIFLDKKPEDGESFRKNIATGAP